MWVEQCAAGGRHESEQDDCAQGSLHALCCNVAWGKQPMADTAHHFRRQDDGISAFPDADNIQVWAATISGSKETPYEGTNHACASITFEFVLVQSHLVADAAILPVCPSSVRPRPRSPCRKDHAQSL